MDPNGKLKISLVYSVKCSFIWYLVFKKKSKSLYEDVQINGRSQNTESMQEPSSKNEKMHSEWDSGWNYGLYQWEVHENEWERYQDKRYEQWVQRRVAWRSEQGALAFHLKLLEIDWSSSCFESRRPDKLVRLDFIIFINNYLSLALSYHQ